MFSSSNTIPNYAPNIVKKVKGKAIPGSRMLRLPDFMTIGT
jgi:hypothetical protein